MTTLGTLLFTWLRGEQVGTDAAGNKYYREKGGRKIVKGGGMESRERRWVVYHGIVEASKVPPEWHGWLHHTTDERPPADLEKRPWQKEHLPNLTGTTLAYHPPGSVVRGGHRARATGDYEAWTPN
ncbi:NADH dehydrogenase [Aliidongia dinghuensis]|uniref:NADH dehydrogenase n=1 Tax=Aliidongia dinghuensis TaxID=1867774 RepID=A0A8J3E6P8_9PROT|nr:NADH:ubiquinone oxidoreductase subunit NDUFA12 [Aliidongia dinghuensis]GGF31595.1 NADH dehydrogenase [Aliidongia dinghuensis]